VPEARELEAGHLHHVDVPRNPVNDEVEDTDVGFPGPEHHTAEGSLPMKLAMGVLAIGAIVAGFLQIPNVTEAVDHFLEPTFAGSTYFEELHPSDSATFVGLAIGAVLSLAGIAVAYAVWVRRPGTSTRVRERFAPLHRLFVNKWYFDELIDTLIVAPARLLGGFAQSVFERVVINGVLTDGTSGLVRASSTVVRAGQTGFLRYYTALIVVGMVALLAYFLLNT
jgi:NADH-quinone oxidoreductase subunit L